MTNKANQETESVRASYDATKPARQELAEEVPGASAAAPTVHFLKAWPEHFAAVKSGSKPFEVRRDDRAPRFETGDVAVLQEFDPERAAFVGSGWQVFGIGHVDRSKCLPDDWCAFALDKATAKQKRAAVDAAMAGKGSK